MELYNKLTLKIVIDKHHEEFYMPKILFNSYKGLRLETKLAYVAILDTLINNPSYRQQDNMAFIKVNNPNIAKSLAVLANKEVDQDKINKYITELLDANLIEVNKQDLFVYDLES